MIQRIQSLWLLLAAIFAFFTFKFSFYSGQKMENEIVETAFVNAGETLPLMLLTGAVTLLSLVTLFAFKNRRTQLTLCIITTILSFVLLVVYYLEIQKFTSGTIALSCLFAVAIPIFLLLAAWGIYKDEKLIKSLDRLR